MTVVVQLSHIHKTYGNGTVALQDFSIDVGSHEFIALLGPSGCGKSTALRLIAGLMAPTQGEIVWPEARDASTHALSYVFQEPTLMPWAKVIENVRLPLKLKGESAAQNKEKVAQHLAMVGLEDFAQVYPRELSGGMKMRVSIARALITAPSLLLMDEPFAALDEMTRAKLNDDVLALWAAQHFTVMFVTHSVFEAVYLSSRIVVMGARPGRVIEEIINDEPYPRAQSYRTTTRYNALCIRVSEALQRAGALTH